MLILIGGVAARMAWLQLDRHDYFSTRSDDNRMRIQVVPPVRGLIYDRNGVILAENLPSYRLEVVPEQVDDMEDMLIRLAPLVDIREEDLERFHKRRKRSPRFRGVPLRFLLTPEEVARFEVNRAHFPGVQIVAGLTRNYPLGASAAHLVGYVGGITETDLAGRDPEQYRGSTHIGKTGVEYSYEDVLHGIPGSRVIEANAAGRFLRELEYNSPRDGKNLYLSIDARLQIAAEAAMGEEEGAIVAIDPNNGEVLALVSQPTYNPQLFVEGISHKDYQALLHDPGRPLFNRALRGQYPPGSTTKPLMSLAGLEYGVVNKHTRKYCPGYFQLGNRPRKYRCWQRRGHGSVDMDFSIFQSCDVYYYHLGETLGIDRIHSFLSRFGLGQKTGIDLPREKAGVLPSQEWKRAALNQVWYPGETISAVIGQGFFTATPLQLAHATSQIAKKGHGYKPHVLLATEDRLSSEKTAFTNQAFGPIELRRPVHWNEITHAMELVVHGQRGTARRIGEGVTYRIAGKTGTSQVAGLKQDEEAPDMEDVIRKLRDHALFVSFAPADKPEIAVAVLVEHGGSGSGAAAPVARKVLDAWLVDRVNSTTQENP